jgi:hypothetical protein
MYARLPVGAVALGEPWHPLQPLSTVRFLKRIIFYRMGLLAPCPSSILEDQGVPLSLDYHRSLGHRVAQAPPPRQGGDTFGGLGIYQKSSKTCWDVGNYSSVHHHLTKSTQH